MRQKLIAVDIDDVLSSQVDALIDFVAQHYDLELTVDNFKAPGDYWTYFEQLPGLDPELSAKMFQSFLDAEKPFDQVISPEAIQTIRYLQEKGYRLEVITSRGLQWQVGTEAWLEKHLPNVFNNVHFVELWNKDNTKATKAMICQEIGAGYLIDDNAEHCNLADEAGVQALLFGEWGWNMFQTVRPGVRRVLDWKAVREYFDEQG